jgi:hypothetical protein
MLPEILNALLGCHKQFFVFSKINQKDPLGTKQNPAFAAWFQPIEGGHPLYSDRCSSEDEIVIRTTQEL